MKKRLNWIILFLAIFCLIGYFGAELIIRGDALNKVSFGIGGWLFGGGIVLLIICWGIVPIVSLFLSSFPEWIDPQTIPSSNDRIVFLEKYGRFLLRQFHKDPPQEIVNDIQVLRELFAQKNSIASDKYPEQVSLSVLQIRQTLVNQVSKRIIHEHMKKTAIYVMISQRGLFDSIVMFIMQMRLAAELGKVFGYRPSWLFLSYYALWVMVNSIIFALFDSTDTLDDSMNELIGLFAGEKLGKMIPFFGKASSIMIQGATSMAIIYASGNIIQRRLLGNTKRLPPKERIRYRLEGLKEAAKLYPSLLGETANAIRDYFWNRIKEPSSQV